MSDDVNRRPRIRVVLAEDEGLYRDLLRLALESTGRIQVAGCFPDGPSTLARALSVHPQVAILDIQLGPGPNGLQVGRLLRRQDPRLGIVLLSHHADPSFLSGVPDSELSGWSYLVKRSVPDLETFVRAVEGAAAGFVVLDPLLVQGGRPRRDVFLQRLTPRQREILELIAQGYTNAAIAEHLQLSVKTVANHINALYEELGIDRDDGSLQPRVRAVLAYLQELRSA